MITQSAILAITGLVLFGITNAYADHGWYVSAESEVFENHFSGAQIIEVIIHGGSLNTPIVTVDDNPLPMFQGQSGNWYGYFVEKDKASEAQDLGLFDFGMKAELNTYECPTIWTVPLMAPVPKWRLEWKRWSSEIRSAE